MRGRRHEADCRIRATRVLWATRLPDPRSACAAGGEADGFGTTLEEARAEELVRRAEEELGRRAEEELWRRAEEELGPRSSSVGVEATGAATEERWELGEREEWRERLEGGGGGGRSSMTCGTRWYCST